jgi:hypothetical protein
MGRCAVSNQGKCVGSAGIHLYHHIIARLYDTVGCYRLDDRTCRRGQRAVRVEQIWWNQYLKVLVIDIATSTQTATWWKGKN